MINSRSLDDLHPRVKVLCEKFIAECHNVGIDVLITSTYRDAESQNALYAQGRTTKGNIVTNAKAGQSWHNWRCAFDFVPIVGGKAMWSDTNAFIKCGRIAESIGLEWAGSWAGKFKEMAHCQYTGGLSLADLQAGKQIK
jgi:peptidoglycan L-alanyl-D-glutamate endopeptidase CwlK